MTSAGDVVVGSSFLDSARYYVYDICATLTHALGLASNITVQDIRSPHLFVEWYDDVITWLAFDEFQVKLLKGFLFILFSNVLLIFISWKVYGKKISERFMKPASSKAIEELKKSVSLLKLPKEHSPRV